MKRVPQETAGQPPPVSGFFLSEPTWIGSGSMLAGEIAALRCEVAFLRQELANKGRHSRTTSHAVDVKGTPGRRGYPLEALEYAKKLRHDNPTMKVQALRMKCLEKFSEDDLPPDADSFRRWLNRKRANRAN
jgi:hypothetical protein